MTECDITYIFPTEDFIIQPCPFCGRDVICWCDNSGWEREYKIFCFPCNLLMCSDDKYELIERWNGRAGE